MSARPLDQQKIVRIQIWIGAGLATVAFLVYLVTMCRLPFPGESARVLALHLGLDPFTPLNHPVWGILMRSLAALPLGLSLVMKVHLFGAVAAAVSTYCIYKLALFNEHNKSSEELHAHGYSKAQAHGVSAVITAVVFAFSLPVWFVATRAHTQSLEMLILLLAVTLLFRAYRQSRWTWLILTSFLTGLGCVEAPLFLLYMPFIAFFTVLTLVLIQRLSVSRLTACLIAFAAPLFLSVYAAQRFQQSQSFYWRSFEGLFQAFKIFWRDQIFSIPGSVPQVGWMLLGLICIVPWLSIAVFPRKKDTPYRGAVIGSLVYRIVLTALAVMVFFNISITPWNFLKFRPLLIVPYIFCALWIGYLFGYWYIIIFRGSRAGTSGPVQKVSQWLYYPVCAGLCLSMLLLNQQVVNGRPLKHLQPFMQNIFSHVEDDMWVITDGVLDPVVAIQASNKDLNLKLISPAMARSKAYLEYVSSLFDDPRLKGLARVGLSPLMNEWFQSSERIHEEVVGLGHPEIWYLQDLTPVPRGYVYQSVPALENIAPDDIMVENRSFWESMQVVEKLVATDQHNLCQPLFELLLKRSSKAANNLGVAMEDAGYDDYALESYQQARVLNTNNISALMNLVTISERIDDPALADVQAEFDHFLQSVRQRYEVWALSYHYGMVRHPQAFAQSGMAWAMSGVPRLAIREIQKAIRAGETDESLQLSLASLYLSEQRGEESEALYLRMLEENPDHGPALLGLLRVATLSGNFDAARGYLGRLRELEYAEGELLVEEAAIAAMEGKLELALDIVDRVTKEYPDNARGWVSAALLALEAGDDELLQKASEKLNAMKSSNPNLLLAVARMQYARRLFPQARDNFERVLRQRPNHQYALQYLLRMDMYEGKIDEADRHVERILSIAPDHAFANYVLGSLQLMRGEEMLAETSFQKALEKEEVVPAMNDLAWLLQKRGELEQARKLAERAVELEPRLYPAWDTYGVILFKQGELDQAMEVLQKAASLMPGDPTTMLHIALIYEQQGLEERVIEILDDILENPALLDPETLEEARDLSRRVR